MRLLKRRANLSTTSRATKFFCFCLICAVLCVTFFVQTPKVEPVLADGRAESVMELSTGKILHSRNADARLPMASTTKIMTALIIIEDCDLEQAITVPDDAVGVEGSSIYLKKNERISIRDLLYGLMLRSGNDAATALALYHSGSIQKFAEQMNERAADMGLTNTHFVNPSGLPDECHFTTAAELCTIACNAMKNDTFKKIVSTRNYTGEYRSFVNKNKMLSRMDGANGIKTGYTMSAGRCLVSSAERDGMDVVCVVLNCPDMYERSEELLEQAFSTYCLKQIGNNRVFMCDIVPCKLSKDCTLLVKKNEDITFKIIKTNNHARINVGDEIARLEIYCQNDLIFSENLYSIVNRNNIF